jgi:hypothetical protein
VAWGTDVNSEEDVAIDGGVVMEVEIEVVDITLMRASDKGIDEGELLLR